MREKIAIVVAAAVLLAVPVAAEDVSGFIEIGGRSAGETGNMNRAAEYRSTESGPTLEMAIQAAFDAFYLELASTAVASDRQEHALTLDLDRMVRSHTTFTRLPHRLQHDSLANLEGTVKEVVYTGADDLDPNARYSIRYEYLTNHTELQVPDAPWLTVTTDFREQWREGHEQALALSHCSACHVTSMTRSTDQHLREGGMGVRVAAGNWTVNGTYSSRDFRERAASPTNVYDLAVHPALRKAVFNDRIWYDGRDGALAFDVNPSTEKDTWKVKVTNPDLGGFAVSVVGVSSNVENTATGNTVDYDGVNFMAARRFGKKARFSLRARTYSIESSDYFVDVPDPVATAGYVGQTYYEHYGFQPDFLRQSAIDRDVTEAEARLYYRLARKTSLTGTYSVRSLDREYYHVAVGETKTLEQKLKISLSARPVKGLQLRAAATYADISNPFMLIDGSCQTEVQPYSVPSPMAPGSQQYYQLHDSRIADTTASPSEYAEIRLSGSYQLGVNSLATVTYRWWDGSNDEHDLTDWSKTIDAITANVMWAPTESSQLYAAASYGKRELETRFCIPLMDG